MKIYVVIFYFNFYKFFKNLNEYKYKCIYCRKFECIDKLSLL